MSALPIIRPAGEQVVRSRKVNRVIRPQNWFRETDGGGAYGQAAGQVADQQHIISPSDPEAEALLEASPCMSCHWFDYTKGQHILQRDRVVDMIALDAKMGTMFDGLDPTHLGACEARDWSLTSQYATCQAFRPKGSRAAAIWRNAKTAIERFREQREAAHVQTCATGCDDRSTAALG